MCLKDEENKTWVQCRHCGEIYQVYNQYQSDVLFIDSWCPECETENDALVLGEDIDDIYIMMDINLDGRYYTY